MKLNFTFLKKFATEHPVSLQGLIFSLLCYGLLAFVLIGAARLGFNNLQVESIIGENLAPKTFELLGTIILLALSARAVLWGAIGIPESGKRRSVIISIPNTALSIQAAMAGVYLGRNVASMLPSMGVLIDVGSPNWWEFWNAAFLLIAAYLMVLTFTVSKTTAPAYSTAWFSAGYRALSLIFLYYMLGRSITLLLILNRVSGT